ncbi:MAG TPA: hypothetical protein DEP66_05400, partial [Acidimicrobiaceae bacterium]|nr:hypothetical protein [Acidimicrobiaceae bacterium]
MPRESVSAAIVVRVVVVLAATVVLTVIVAVLVADRASDNESEPDGALTQSSDTPEYIASNVVCPDGLPRLDPVSDPDAPTAALVPFVELAEVTTLAFLPAASAAPAVPAAPAAGFVGTRGGVVWAFTVPAGPAAPAVLSDTPALDLSADTSTEHDQGLVGMTVGPAGDWLYLNRTDASGDSVLSAHAIERAAPPAHPRLAAGVELLRVAQPSPQHNGGDIVFGPLGYLYVSFGDGGGLGDPAGHAQDLTTPLGAILRLAVDPAAPPAARAVAAPGNPYGAPDDDRIWVSGVRNPFAISYDAPGRRLWVADVGQQCLEEVNALRLAEGGADLGWNAFEGGRPFVGEPVRAHRAPDFEYSHGLGLCSTVGGHVYRGTKLPALAGRYVWADLCGGRVYALDLLDLPAAAGRPPVLDLGVQADTVVGVSAGPDGELYVLDLAYGVHRLVPPAPA